MYKDYIVDQGEAITIEVDMPGVKADDLSLHVDQSSHLIIHGVHKKGTRNRKIERRYFIPKEINDEAVEATLSDGILTVILPRKETPGPRKIPVLSS